jgi:hypothetical protein
MTNYADLCEFRLAVLLKGIYQRSLRDLQHDIGGRALANVARSLAVLGGRSG